MKTARGVSPVVATALLIVIVIVAVLVLGGNILQFTKSSNYVQASMTGSVTTANGQYIHYLTIQLVPKTDRQLSLTDIKLQGAYANGSAYTEDLASPSNTNIQVSPPIASVKLSGKQTVTISIVIPDNNAISSVSALLTFQDDSGHTYTFQTNTVELS